MGITTIISAVKNVVLTLVKNWEVAFAWAASLVIVYFIGWQHAMSEVKVKEVVKEKDLIIIGIDSTKNQLQISDSVDYDLRLNELFLKKRKEALDEEIIRYTTLINNSNCKRSPDWVRIYNDSARPN